ncbi:hypothetical protein ES703_15123 [subsurface metagenome]
MENQIHTRSELITLIQSLTGQTSVLTVPRELSRFLGDDLPAALLLSQLIYWQGKQGRADGAIYKTYAEWYEEIGLTEYQVRRATKKMSEFLRTKIHRANGSPTVHYYLNVGQFSESILKFLKERNRSFSRNETEVSQDSLTETTTKTTSETTTGIEEEEEGETLPSETAADAAAGVLDFFKQNFPNIKLTPVMREELEGYVRDFGRDPVIAAIREACRREDVKQKLPYIRAVLGSWKKDESAAAQEKGRYVNFDSAPHCSFNYEEVLDLVERFGRDGAAARINFLSRHKGSTGQTYASDYETILKWDARGDWDPKPQGWTINEEWLNSISPKPDPGPGIYQRPARRSYSLVVCGYIPGNGSRSFKGHLVPREIASIILGLPSKDGTFSYHGKCGAGFGVQEMTDLYATLQELRAAESVFTEDDELDVIKRGKSLHQLPPVWTRPKVVVEIASEGFTKAGKLTAPMLKRVRPELKPQELSNGDSGKD